MTNCNGIGIEKTIKSFTGLTYAHGLSCLSCCAKWLVCTSCMERQSNSYRMTAHVERCSGTTVKSRETPDINIYFSSWTKWKHNELNSTSSPDAQNLFHMTENDSDGNAGKKQKIQCDFGYHMLAVHHSLRKIQDMKMGVMLID